MTFLDWWLIGAALTSFIDMLLQLFELHPKHDELGPVKRIPLMLVLWPAALWMFWHDWKSNK